jgi:HSP20 family protein
MALQRYEPYREMISLRDAMNSLFQDSFVRPLSHLGEGNAGMLPLDVIENENEFIVKVSLPGVRPEDVHITVHGNDVTIRGEIKADEEKQNEHYHIRERRFGMFQRTVTLTTPISSDKAQATFENGVLTLVLPKAEEAKPKEIKIGSQAQGGTQAQVGGKSQGGTQPQVSGQAQPQTAQASSSS